MTRSLSSSVSSTSNKKTVLGETEPLGVFLFMIRAEPKPRVKRRADVFQQRGADDAATSPEPRPKLPTSPPRSPHHFLRQVAPRPVLRVGPARAHAHEHLPARPPRQRPPGIRRRIRV